MPDIADMIAPDAILAAAFETWNDDPLLAGRGAIERAAPWQDDELPRWNGSWENETTTDFIDGEYDCQMDLVFTVHCMGQGANRKAGQFRRAAQKAIADSNNLSNIVRSVRYRESSRAEDDEGRAITGSLRVVFRVGYETDETGVLVSR